MAELFFAIGALSAIVTVFAWWHGQNTGRLHSDQMLKKIIEVLLRELEYARQDAKYFIDDEPEESIALARLKPPSTSKH
jgi:hypothetical protein